MGGSPRVPSHSRGDLATLSGADDERDDLLLGVGCGDLLTDLAAASHDGGPVGDFHDVVHGVRDDDDRAAVVAEAEDQVEDASRLAYSERGGRLVEDDDSGIERGGPGHRDRLALTAGQQADGGLAFVHLDLKAAEYLGGGLGHGPPTQDAQKATQDAAQRANQDAAQRADGTTPVAASDARKQDRMRRTTVTGSNILRVRPDESLPLLEVDRTYIDRSGATTTPELLRTIPQIQNGR